LNKVFQNIIKFDLYKSANAFGLIETNNQILKIVNIYKPKYVFYPCNFSSILTEETLIEIRKIGSLVVVDYFDDDLLFNDFSRWNINVDYVITHVASLVPKYKEIGLNAILTAAIPMNTSYFRKIDTDKFHDVTFLGSLYDHRKKMLLYFKKNGVHVNYFGGGNENKIHISEMVKIFNNSKIVLNITTGKLNREIIQGRVFEVTLSGSFLLTEYIPGIENWFEIGSEIECFYDPDDAIKKIRFYLLNDFERERIALNGYKKAINNYTGPVILNDIKNYIENDCNKIVDTLPKINIDSNNPFKKYNANEYFKWAKAALSLNDTKRNDWIKVCDLVLNNDPDHSGAKWLKFKYKVLGDPEPFNLMKVKVLTRIFTLFSKFNIYLNYIFSKK